MYLKIGRPECLRDFGAVDPPVSELKKSFEIAVIDDEPFVLQQSLSAHGFRLVEIGGDISSVDQLVAFPVVVCDIKGVGRKFGSKYEGAHVLAEIRKAYPDKYLIAYTGMTFDATYNEILRNVDKSVSKDASVDLWTQLLETGLKNVGDPRERWIRFRSTLLARGMDTYDAAILGQAFVRAIKKGDSSILTAQGGNLKYDAETIRLVVKFAATLAQLISLMAKHT